MRILIAEDDDSMRGFLTLALEKAGHRVTPCADGLAAYKAAEDFGASVDLLLADIVMPGMDGPTVARTIREKNPALKIIFISGYTEDRLKDYMGPGIFFLPKPFTLKQLAEKVKEVLGA